jgi:hypothetical protein
MLLMLFYFSLFLAFVYFKIARVYIKEEKQNINFWVQNIIVAAAIVALLVYGFTHERWYMVLLIGYLFFIAASLLVSAVQLGIFIYGKPFVKISNLYKMQALFGMLITFTDLYLWGV